MRSCHMFFRGLCTLIDYVWKLFSPDKSKTSLRFLDLSFSSKLLLLVVVTTALPVRPVAYGVCFLPVGMTVLCCQPPACFWLPHISLCALHEAGVKYSLAWLDGIFNSAVLALYCT